MFVRSRKAQGSGRRLRRFQPGGWSASSFGARLEARSLAAPAFFRATTYGAVTAASGWDIPTNTGLGPQSGGPTASQGDSAANSTDASPQVTVDQQMGGGLGMPTMTVTAWETESGAVNNTVAQPAPPPSQPGSSSNTLEIEINVTQTSSDTVGALAGPNGYAVGAPFPTAIEQTTAATTGAAAGNFAFPENLHWSLQDTGGSNIPMNTHLNVTFSANMTAGNQDPRFWQTTQMVLISSFVDATVFVGVTPPAGVPRGLAITSPSSGAVLYADPNFGPNSSEVFQTSIPIVSDGAVDMGAAYWSQFTTGVDGTFGVNAAETVSAPNNLFSWSLQAALPQS